MTDQTKRMHEANKRKAEQRLAKLREAWRKQRDRKRNNR